MYRKFCARVILQRPTSSAVNSCKKTYTLALTLNITKSNFRIQWDGDGGSRLPYVCKQRRVEYDVLHIRVRKGGKKKNPLSIIPTNAAALFTHEFVRVHTERITYTYSFGVHAA